MMDIVFLLTVCIEQCLTFGLCKKSKWFTKMTLSTIISNATQIPGPFQDAWMNVNKDAKNRSSTENAKVRAWIRNVLNDKTLADGIQKLIQANENDYENWSIMKSNDRNELKRQIQKLDQLKFEFTCNDVKRLENDQLYETITNEMDMYRVKHNLPRLWIPNETDEVDNVKGKAKVKNKEKQEEEEDDDEEVDNEEEEEEEEEPQEEQDEKKERTNFKRKNSY